jgi:hypothetical protein
VTGSLHNNNNEEEEEKYRLIFNIRATEYQATGINGGNDNKRTEDIQP